MGSSPMAWFSQSWKRRKKQDSDKDRMEAKDINDDEGVIEDVNEDVFEDVFEEISQNFATSTLFWNF